MADKSILKYGLPFLSFMILGSFLLREFTSIRYEVHSYKRKYWGLKPPRVSSNEDNEIVMPQEKEEEKELEKLISMGKSEEWKNIRGPRPWEDNKEFKELLETRKKK